MKLSIQNEAEQDIERAADFYRREGSAALAMQFLAEFRRLSQLVLEHPGIGSPRQAMRRGFRMRVFPYTVIYRVTEDEVRILVVRHDRQRPGYGAGRR
jgi:plasmid stabilization system protein ParE